MQYLIEDLVKLAKRDSNSARPYLYVNPLQGKHIPAVPEDILAMCSQLAEIVNSAYPDQKLYIVGFAETATGISAGTAHFLKNVCFYQNTTRETRKNKDYLYFTESHSHAVDQMLFSDGIGEVLEQVDRMIFIDDEVTTGNTIVKLIHRIKENYSANHIRFSIVSVLNSMTEERREELRKNGIECLYLCAIPHEYRVTSIRDVHYQAERETDTVSDKVRELIRNNETEMIQEQIDYPSETDVRSVASFEKYDREVRQFAGQIINGLAGSHYGRILVLGTEEFMYPAICLGDRIKSADIADEVRVHATTRSPIIASGEEDYPLYHRYKLRSMYDPDRETFIYNLEKYDKVIMVTDSEETGLKGTGSGRESILNALMLSGNRDILITRWCYS